MKLGWIGLGEELREESDDQLELLAHAESNGSSSTSGSQSSHGSQNRQAPVSEQNRQQDCLMDDDRVRGM